MSEQWYDEEIAPTLMELGRKCEAKGIAFIAVVEYKTKERARTVTIPDHAGLEMRMIDLCARSAPNIDAYIIALIRYCREHGIPTDSSIVMNRMGAREGR